MKGAIEPVYNPMMGGREAIMAYAIPVTKEPPRCHVVSYDACDVRSVPSKSRCPTCNATSGLPDRMAWRHD